jgi:septal ring factor EnvC (AmiA/AmiB activator)
MVPRPVVRQRWTVAIVASGVAFLILIAGAFIYSSTRSDLKATRATLNATTSKLHATQARLSSTEEQLRSATSELDSTQQQLRTTNKAWNALLYGCTKPVLREWYHGNLFSLADVIHGPACQAAR